MRGGTGILTIDVGTSSVKCALINKEGVLASRSIPYPTRCPRPGYAEQDIDEIMQAAISAAHELVAVNIGFEVVAIGLTGHMNGCLAVNEFGEPLHPHIIHADGRAHERLPELRSAISDDDFFNLTGGRLDCHLTLPKILWLRHHLPDVYKNARHFMNTKDAVYARLTGVWGVTDLSDASLAGALNMPRKQWAYGLLRDLGIPHEKLGEIRHSTDTSHGLTAEAAQLLGLKQGTPVALGGGDGACAGRGAGLTGLGAAYSCIGSTAWVSVFSQTPTADDRLFCYVDMGGEYYSVCGTTQSGCSAIDWASAAIGSGQPLSFLENEALSSPPGSRGAMFAPYLQGERTPHWNATITGGFAGLRIDHARADMLRSVWEGVAYALADCAEAIAESCGPISRLTLVGGGARSLILPESLSALIGCPVARHLAYGEATSLGAAMAAAVGVGFVSSWEEAALWASTEPYKSANANIFAPLLAQRIRWRALYPAFCSVSEWRKGDG